MLTPLDIYGKTFGKGFRGYEQQEVDSFLATLVKDFEDLYKENIELKERQELLNGKLASYQQLEKTMQNTLLVAQTTAEELKESARRESELLLKETENKAKLLLSEAELGIQAKKQELNGFVAKHNEELEQIKKQVNVCKAKLRNLLETELALLNQEPEAKSDNED